MRRQQRAKERRKTILFVGIAVVLGLALISAVAIPTYLDSRNDPLKKDLAALGVPAAQAGCNPVQEDPPTAGADHKPEGEKVDYPTVPPSSGPHAQNFEVAPRAFYTKDDTPSVERLVHSLEHGHTILWYDSTVTGDQLDMVKDIAARARTEDASRNKFIAAPLDESRGPLPEGKHIALSHWGDSEPRGENKTAWKAYRQICAAPSGDVVAQFVKAHPASDAPEAGAA
jgi:hypothetical protein